MNKLLFFNRLQIQIQMMEKILKVPIIHNFLFRFYHQDHYYVIKELLIIAINSIMALPKPDFKLSFLRQLSRTPLCQEPKNKSNEELILKEIEILKNQIEKLNQKNQEIQKQQQHKLTKEQNIVIPQTIQIIQKIQDKTSKRHSNNRKSITPKITQIDYPYPAKVSSIKVQRHHLDDIQLKQILKYNNYLDCQATREKVIDKKHKDKLQGIQSHLPEKIMNTVDTQIQAPDNASLISTKRLSKTKPKIQSKIKDMIKIDKQNCQIKYHTQRPTIINNQFSQTFSPFDNEQDHNYQTNAIQKKNLFK